MLEKNSAGLQKSQDTEIDLIALMKSIWSYKSWLVLTTFLFCFFGAIYAISLPSVYKAQSLIQVEKKNGNSLFGDLTSVIVTNQLFSFAAETEIIKSRMVIGKTVDEMNLTTQVKPYYYPIIGSFWAKITGKEPPQISISRFDVPDDLLNEEWKISVQSKDQFVLKYGKFKLTGKVGELLNKDGIILLVNDLKAPVGQQFLLSKSTVVNVYEHLVKNLSVISKGGDGGILSVQLTGQDPELIQRILNHINYNYLLQNVERKSEEASKSLDFLDEQLPKIRLSLKEAENKLHAFRQQHDSVDLSLEAKVVLDNMVTVESQLQELAFKEAEVSKLYTKKHPSYTALLEKRKVLEKEKGNLLNSVNQMPSIQQEILSLTRDVQASQAVYMQLLNKQQEIEISKAGTTGNVRIIDQAITKTKPIAPNRLSIVIISALLGLFLSLCIILFRILSNSGIKTVEELEMLDLKVLAMIPTSQHLRRKGKSIISSDGLLALNYPLDITVESIRSLRTSLYFLMQKKSNHILMITSPTQDVGKSFVSTNLAIVFAQSKKRVLLIDTDMRRGTLSEMFSTSNVPGLSTYLSNNAKKEEIIVKTKVEGLDFISNGESPDYPTELLFSNSFKQLLEWANDNYDIVIVDVPPVLPVTDPSIIGLNVGTVILATRYNLTTQREVKMSLFRLNNSGIQVDGVILNDIEPESGSSHYGYYYYGDKKDKK